jgi:predicted alpha/beta superfamily hydrolase
MFKRTVGGIVLVFAGAVGGILGYYALENARTEEEVKTYEDWAKQQKVTPVKFVVRVPEGTPKDQPIFLSGSMPPFPWDAAGPPLTREADGTYTTTLDLMTGLPQEFKVTRGTWGTVECNADDTDVANRIITPKGDDTVEVKVAAWRDKGAATPGRVTLAGDIRQHRKVSDGAIGNDRNLTVYLPPGYDDAANKDVRYPVLYLQDGQNLFDESVSYNGVEWKADETAQRLIGEGKIEPVIIVGIWNTAERNAEYTPQAMSADGATSRNEAYANLVVGTIKPLIDATYRTKPDAPNTAIGGAAMGGLAAISVAQQKPDVFGKLLLLTPHLSENGKPISALVADGAAFKGKKVWLDMSPTQAGPAGYPGRDAMAEAKAFADLLAKAGLDEKSLKFAELPEAPHNEPSWQARFDQVLLWLYAK